MFGVDLSGFILVGTDPTDTTLLGAKLTRVIGYIL
jgi:hypothetical protein